MHNGNGFTFVKPIFFSYLVNGPRHANSLVPDGVALCSYFFLNNIFLRHIFCEMTIVAVQLTGLAVIVNGRQIH